jgi:hypothetical protein
MLETVLLFLLTPKVSPSCLLHKQLSKSAIYHNKPLGQRYRQSNLNLLSWRGAGI